MRDEQRRAAKERLIAGMLRGQPWDGAAADAGLETSRSTAYRWAQTARAAGAAVLDDGRHGHASKLREPVRAWLVAHCRDAPHVASQAVQVALVERFGLAVSVRQINYVRAALGVSKVPRRGTGQGAGGKCVLRGVAGRQLAGWRGRAPLARRSPRHGPHPRFGDNPPRRWRIPRPPHPDAQPRAPPHPPLPQRRWLAAHLGFARLCR